MEALFWISVAFVAYVYVGYPALLGVWAWATPSRASRRGAAHASLPGVSVIIAARNEAPRLAARVANLVASDYPQDRLQIIIASDGSTDDTADVVATFGPRVELLLLPPAGKPAALNAAVAIAKHPILVFADARQRFAPDAIRRLVAHFRDPQIGAVSGELILDCERDRGVPASTGFPAGAEDGERAARSTIGAGVGAYWKYEKWLRRCEAVVGSSVGVTGAIYAMRRWLWQPLPGDTLLDDVLAPMNIVLRGYRVTFESRAHAFDETATDAAAEMRRKVRTLAGNFQLLAQQPRLLVPGMNPVWLQFVSHKVGRLLVPYALVAMLLASAWLAPTSLAYALALLGQLGFYSLAAYGAVLDRRARQTRAGGTNEVAREAA